MAKITLPTITSGYNLTKLNEALQAIQDELNDKVLYRDNPAGEDNTLETDIDFNSKRILNLPAPTSQAEPIRKIEWDQTVGAAEDARDAAQLAQSETETLLLSRGEIRNTGAYQTGFNYLVSDLFQASDSSWYIVDVAFTSTSEVVDVADDEKVTPWQSKHLISLNSFSELADTTGLFTGQKAVVAFYHDITNLKGGGIFVWKTAGRHNGGTFIDPTRTFPTDWTNDTQVDAWFLNSGSDAAGWERQEVEGEINIQWFGARGTVDMRDIAGSWDSTKSVAAAGAACIVSIPKSATPADDEDIWGYTLKIPEGLFKITSPQLDYLTTATESVTVKGVGRMSRLLYSPSAVVADTQAQTGLFNLDLVRHGFFSDFSVINDFDKPGHGFDMGECSKTTFKDLTLYLTAGSLTSSPDESELKFTDRSNYVYGFRYNEATGNSILNLFDNVRIGDGASLNNGLFVDGAQGVIGWGDDLELTGGTVTLNGTNWVSCTAESILSAVKFEDVTGLNCNMKILAEGMFNEFVLFPTLQASPNPTGTTSASTMTSNLAVPTHIKPGHYVFVIAASRALYQMRRITGVSGNVLTVEQPFDYNESNVEFQIVNIPVLSLTGLQGSTIDAYVESSLASHPTANLQLSNLYASSFRSNDVRGYYDAFSSCTTGSGNEFEGFFNGLSITGLAADNRMNSVHQALTNSSAWSVAGIHCSPVSNSNYVGTVTNVSNGAMVGRIPQAAIPVSSDANLEFHSFSFLTTTTPVNNLYITENWAMGNTPHVGNYQIFMTFANSSGVPQGTGWAIVTCESDGTLTIEEQFSSAGNVDFSVAANAVFEINNNGTDKSFVGWIRRNHANTGVYGVSI